MISAKKSGIGFTSFQEKRGTLFVVIVIEEIKERFRCECSEDDVRRDEHVRHLLSWQQAR